MHKTNNARIDKSPINTPINLPYGPDRAYPIAYSNLPTITPNPSAAAGRGK